MENVKYVGNYQNELIYHQNEKFFYLASRPISSSTRTNVTVFQKSVVMFGWIALVHLNVGYRNVFQILVKAHSCKRQKNATITANVCNNYMGYGKVHHLPSFCLSFQPAITHMSPFCGSASPKQMGCTNSSNSKLWVNSIKAKSLRKRPRILDEKGCLTIRFTALIWVS